MGSDVEVWRAFRLSHGFAATAPALLSPPGANAKLVKAVVPTYGLSLSPARTAGPNVCKFSTPSCRAGCLTYAGRGQMSGVQRGRMVRTRFFHEHRDVFARMLSREVLSRARAHDGVLVRLNVFSDVPWLSVLGSEWFAPLVDAGARFYDYTKDPGQLVDPYRHVTFSASERTTDVDLVALLASGHNVAMVGSTRPPAVWHGFPVVDGDATDDRTLDPPGSVVWLKAKGPLKADPKFAPMLVGDRPVTITRKAK